MSTEIPGNLTEAELLHQYIGKRITNGDPDASVSDLLHGYVEYRRELTDLRTKVREAEEASVRGESKELDVEALIAEVTEQLAQEGIA